MASLNFKKVGGLVKIEFNSEPDYYVPALQTKIRFYEPSDGTSFLIVSVDADKYQLSAITEIKVDGVAVTNQADFETKIATVFPNANTGSGGSWGGITGTLSAQTDLQSALDAKFFAMSRTAVKTSAYSAAANDYVPVDTTSGSVTVTLPTAPANKTLAGVKHIIQGSTNTVTIATGGSDVINKAGGGTSLTVVLLNQGYILEYDSATAIWTAIADNLTLSSLDARYQATLAIASVAEVNIGTDNAKLVTALDLEGSKYLTQAGAKISCTASGTDTYTGTFTPAIIALVSGQRFFVTFTNANTGPATFNPNGLGAVPLKKNGSTALGSNDLPANSVALIMYDGTNFQVAGLNNTLLTGITGGQTITGSTSTNSGLDVKATSGVGATGADINFKVGNNGATTAMTIFNSGNINIGGSAAPAGKLQISGSSNNFNSAAILAINSSSAAAAGATISVQNNSSKYVQLAVGSSGYTGNAYGIAYANAAEVTGSVSSLIFGNIANSPAYMITNSVVVQTWAANGSVGLGQTSPAASSILDITSTTKGFLPPRMTKAQRDAISSPATGLTIWQTDNTPGLRSYNGTSWMRYTETAD